MVKRVGLRADTSLRRRNWAGAKETVMTTTHRRIGAFTLLDLLIVIVILSILAAIAIPLFNSYVADASDASAESSYDSARKALDLYYMENGTWPEEITASLFTNSEAPNLPEGYEFEYDSDSGSLELVLVEEDEEEEGG